MVKADLGDKQLCPNCGAKFYDLRKRPAVCPKCQTAFDPADETVKLKRVRARQPAYEPAYEDDEEKPRVKGEEGEEEEVEETPEIDAEDVEEVVALEDDDAPTNPDDLPPGFSEEEADLEDETVAEDEIPTLDDEEEFNEDEIGDIPDKDDE